MARRRAPFLGTIHVDATDRDADWPKRSAIDLGGGDVTEEAFAEFMEQQGITPEHLRRMQIFSPENRLLYPWLDKLAGLPG